MNRHNTTEKKNERITGVCFQWRDSGSYDSEVQIETFVLRRKFSGEIATEQQPPTVSVHALKTDQMAT